MEDKHVKILFRFYSSILDEETVETIGATVTDQQKGLYKIDNIPFYAFVACDDIVFAEHDEDENMLTYRDTIEYSGNSTIHIIIINDKGDVAEIRDIFNALGCESESLNNKYLALAVPKAVNYKKIKEALEDLEKKEILEYSESCMADGHWSDVYKAM